MIYGLGVVMELIHLGGEKTVVSGGVKMYEKRRFENVGKKLGYLLVTGKFTTPVTSCF